jgi:enoyl-CoA hydratase/carnithine racemase
MIRQAPDEPRVLGSRRGTNQLQLFGGQMSKLRFEKNGNTGFITLTDPPDNKIGSAFNKEFREALHEVAVSDVRALVIRSEGENFCNGADVLEFAQIGTENISYLGQ